MQRVHAVGVEESRQIRRATNAADGDHIMVWYLQFDQGFLNSGEYAEIATTGAPVGIHFAFQIGKSQLSSTLHACRHEVSPYTIISCIGTERLVFPASCSFTASTMWCGIKGSPSYLRICPLGTRLVSLRR